MNIKPLRDVDQHDILPFFALQGGPANKGTIVSVVGSGLNLTDVELDLFNISNINGTFSSSFQVPWKVAPAASGAPAVAIVGMLLKDTNVVTDENGYPLVYEPRKAAEMDVIVSGQATPIAKKGFFLYSGIVGTPGPGSGAAVSDAGDGSLKVVDPRAGGFDATKLVGKFLGPKDSAGYAPLDFNVS